MVEVLDIRKENNIRIDQNDVSTKLLKKGLYDFDADHEQIRALKGAVEVHVKDQNIKVTDRRALALSAPGKLKAQDYDTLRYEDDFFRWSGLRSGYLSEASVEVARVYSASGPFFQRTGFSIARSGGASTRRSSSTGLRSSTTATGVTKRTRSVISTVPMDTDSSRAADFTAGASVVVCLAELIAESSGLWQGPFPVRWDGSSRTGGYIFPTVAWKLVSRPLRY